MIHPLRILSAIGLTDLGGSVNLYFSVKTAIFGLSCALSEL